MAHAPDPRRLAARQRAEAAANYRIVVHVDGNAHTFRLTDVSALDVAELRKATGWTVARLIAEMSVAAPELDAVAAAVFLARRQAGDRTVTWDDVAGGIGWGQEIITRHEDEPEVDAEVHPDPQPSGVG